MRILAYHPSSFREVKEVLRKTQNAPKYGAAGRILFNDTKERFEVYDPGDDNIDDHSIYTHVNEAMNNYPLKEKAKMSKSFSQIDEEMTLAENKLVTDDDGRDHAIEHELRETSEDTFDVISNISKRITQENREKMLAVISEIFKLDVVSESDILKTILEHGKYRKFLSYLLSGLGVEVAFTRTSFDLKVSTGKIKFSEQAEYSYEDYEKGIVQSRSVIERVKESTNLIVAKDAEIDHKDKIIKTLESKIQELNNQIEAANAKAKSVREIKPVVPIYYLVMFEDNKTAKFLTVDKAAKQTEDGSYPTKYLEKTAFSNKAKKFTHSEAIAQIAKMIKYSHNVGFVDIKDKSPKELAVYFSLVRVLIEKPEAITE